MEDWYSNYEVCGIKIGNPFSITKYFLYLSSGNDPKLKINEYKEVKPFLIN